MWGFCVLSSVIENSVVENSVIENRSKGHFVLTTSKPNFPDRYFSQGTGLDLTRAWHFKHGSTYCVAPLVRRDLNENVVVPATGSTDFFVVGKDCCSVSSSDFRCPGYETPHARAGVRVVRGYWASGGSGSQDSDEQFFQLAVQQWETRYGATSTYPIFLEWV